jgi:hypothetical protein
MKYKMRVATFAAFIVCGSWGIFFLITLAVGCGGNIESFGNMGDAFGILNTLFAGLALVAIVTQLWMQQIQINEERQSRDRADRISALATLIQVTFDKILHERSLLLQVAPGFKNVSFLHEGDGGRLQDATNAKEGMVLSLKKMIATRESYLTWKDAQLYAADDLKDLWDNEAALPMMKQIKKWVDQLTSYEKDMDRLLSHTASDESNLKQ